MKKWGAALLTAAVLFTAVPAASAEVSVPEDEYQWVQATPRQNYYFNKQQIFFAVDANGNINPDVIEVGVLKTYDEIQKEDVRAKRRWNGMSLHGYSDLAGCAEYISINLKDQTVTITQHDDLDSSFAVLSTTKPEQVITLADLSQKNLEGIFYHHVIYYATHHFDDILARTQSVKHATLNKAGQKELNNLQKQAASRTLNY